MKYEIMLILNPKQTDKEMEKTMTEIKSSISEHGYTIVDEDVWGTRKMAYKMKGYSSGHYVVLNFEGEPAGTQGLKTDLRIQANLIRSMIVKVPEDYTLMRFDQFMTTKSGAKVSEHAAELTKKVTESKKAEAKKEEAPKDDKKLDEQLKAIIDDADIDV